MFSPESCLSMPIPTLCQFTLHVLTHWKGLIVTAGSTATYQRIFFFEEKGRQLVPHSHRSHFDLSLIKIFALGCKWMNEWVVSLCIGVSGSSIVDLLLLWELLISSNHSAKGSLPLVSTNIIRTSIWRGKGTKEWTVFCSCVLGTYSPRGRKGMKPECK